MSFRKFCLKILSVIFSNVFLIQISIINSSQNSESRMYLPADYKCLTGHTGLSSSYPWHSTQCGVYGEHAIISLNKQLVKWRDLTYFFSSDVRIVQPKIPFHFISAGKLSEATFTLYQGTQVTLGVWGMSVFFKYFYSVLKLSSFFLFVYLFYF